ncbi:hypothetical protein [Candidatus Nitrotoga sp. AM1P]|uniref:hypothetical protein n=1 Tax=Candidatus Nitrotoga sp. AM1P TaxID=2559597 RepID=UPI0010B4A8A9|nr:hypothetical protein [Candidatus Nitrotoga sp. AM1P]BBJ23047.1 hypothetical protein W01_09740 [Candidatus Nitrotoga sp. AM1P]
MGLNSYISLFAGAALFASQAHAVNIGECATPEAMSAKLKAEDQRSVAYADLITQDKQLRGMIFTINTDRSVGYILQADQPMGDRASTICVYNRMANVRLFDARKPGTPPEVLLKAPEADAMRRCDELAREGKFARQGCGSLNTMIRKGESFRDRVMLQGFSVERQSDDSYKAVAALITISGNVNGSVNDFPDNPSAGITSGILYSSLPDGATIINAVLVYARYTEYGLAALK